MDFRSSTTKATDGKLWTFLNFWLSAQVLAADEDPALLVDPEPHRVVLGRPVGPNRGEPPEVLRPEVLPLLLCELHLSTCPFNRG